MFQLLYRYFLLHHRLSLPSLGSFFLEREKAEFDVVNQTMTPPVDRAAFEQGDDSPSRSLFAFLAKEKNISEWEAIRELNDFAYTLNHKLKAGQLVEIEGIGTLEKNMDGGIRFVSRFRPHNLYQPADARRVIRERAEHFMQVGDSQKTNIEMAGLLEDEAAKTKSRWWIAALVLALMGIGGLLYYLATHNWSFSAANGSVILP